MSLDAINPVNSLNYTVALVHELYDITDIVKQLREAMSAGHTSETFITNKAVSDMREMPRGNIHPMQASRLKALGWEVGRNHNSFEISGWGIPFD